MTRTGVLRALGLAIALHCAGCSKVGGDGARDGGQGAQAAAAAARTKLAEGVVAEGVVVPVRHASMGLSVGGVLREVPVAEGQRVEAGQVLARLEDGEAKARAEAARAELSRAQANVRQLRAGPREVDLAIKKAQIAQVVTVVSEISAASAGQVDGVRQITRAVAQASAITQQVAASAEESASAAEELNAQAGTLNDTVATFQLEDLGVGRGRPLRRSANPRVAHRDPAATH